MAPMEKSAPAGRVAGVRDADLIVGNSSGPIDELSGLGDLDPGLFDLFEQITRSLESGERIDVEQLVAAHPSWADEIRAQLPALEGMARAAAIVTGAPPPLVDRYDLEGRRVLGDFRIIREIGRGGMGIVYEAEQAPLGRKVALKVLPMAAALDPRAIQRFQLEAQVAGWLQHPRIVPVYSVGLVNDVPYFAMRLIEGGSLGALIAELRGFADRGPDRGSDPDSGDSPSALALGLLTGRFAPPTCEAASDRAVSRVAPAAENPKFDEHTKDSKTFREGEAPAELGAATGSSGASPSRARISTREKHQAVASIRGAAYLRTIARLGIQAAEALAYAHDQGIIHRDVKPANLLLDKRGDLWIADFGMADVQGDAGLTLSGDLPGTLRYMSPEQATGQRALVDRRTDIYSLGATLYELLTLQPAVSGSDKVEMIRKIAEEEPAPLRRFNPAVPVDLATIVTKSISKDPAARYQTAASLADDLQRFLDGLPIAARPVGPFVRSWRWCRRKPVQAGLAAALVLALVFGFAGITWNWREAVLQKQEALRQKQEAIHHEQEARYQEQEALRQKALLVVSQGQAEASEKKALTQAARADAINRFLIEKLLRQAAPENNPAAKNVTLVEVLDKAAAEVGTSFKDQPEIEAAIRVALGKTYHDLGDYNKSVTHFRAAYEIQSRMSDERDPDRLKSMVDLGHGLVHLGRLSEAEPYLVDAAEQAVRHLGPTHDLSLSVRGYLGNLRQNQGRNNDAEEIQRRLVDDYRRAHGLKSGNTLAAINNLGTLLQREEKYLEAERLFRECLDLQIAIGGPRYPASIEIAYNLGFVLNQLGRVDEAEKLMRKTYESSGQVFGPAHPTTLHAMGTLGSILRKLGRLDDAETLLRPALEAERRILGPTHSATRLTAANLEALDQQRSRNTDPKPSPAADAPKR